MGRLPLAFAGKNITFRIPYEMAGEITLSSAQTGIQFPDTVFSHNVDKPFEVHRVKPVLTVLDQNGNVIPGLPVLSGTVPVGQLALPPQLVLQQFIRVRISDLGKNELLTKSPTMLSMLTTGTSRETWEWEEPYTIVRSEAFQVVADALSYSNLLAYLYDVTTDPPPSISLRLSLMFQGYLVIVGPPSEAR